MFLWLYLHKFAFCCVSVHLCLCFPVLVFPVVILCVCIWMSLYVYFTFPLFSTYLCCCLTVLIVTSFLFLPVLECTCADVYLCSSLPLCCICLVSSPGWMFSCAVLFLCLYLHVRTVPEVLLTHTCFQCMCKCSFFLHHSIVVISWRFSWLTEYYHPLDMSSRSNHQICDKSPSVFWNHFPLWQ